VAKPARAHAAALAPEADEPVPSARSTGGGNRILDNGLVAPERAPAAEPGAGEALPDNPYE
jgi:hypothetical protein